MGRLNYSCCCFTLLTVVTGLWACQMQEPTASELSPHPLPTPLASQIPQSPESRQPPLTVVITDPTPSPTHFIFEEPRPVPPPYSPDPRITPYPGTVLLHSKITNTYLHCLQTPEPKDPVLYYPTDLAVSPDGEIVYAINTGCTQYEQKYQWQQISRHPTKQIYPPACDEYLKEPFIRPNYIYVLKQNQSPQILKHQEQPVLSCELGLDLEVDQAGDLYISDLLNKQVVQYNFRELIPLFHADFFDIFVPGSSAEHLQEFHPFNDYYRSTAPYLLKAQEKGVLAVFNSTFLGRYHTFKGMDASKKTEEKMGSVPDSPFLYTKAVDSVYLLDHRYTVDLYLLEEYPFIWPFIVYRPSVNKEFHIKWQGPEQIIFRDMVAAPNHIYYLSDIANHSIWAIHLNSYLTEGKLVKVAGTGQAGSSDGVGERASFNLPTSLSLDAKGNLYVADTGNHAIRKITPEGVVSTFYKAPER